MARLVDAGKIRYVGVSNFNADRMRRAHAQLRRHGLALVSNQMSYSLLKRGSKRTESLRRQRAGYLHHRIFAVAQGILTGKFSQTE